MLEFDWPALRGSIVLFAFALAVGGAAAGGAVRFHDEAVRDYERQKESLGIDSVPVSDHRQAEAPYRDVAAGIP